MNLSDVLDSLRPCKTILSTLAQSMYQNKVVVSVDFNIEKSSYLSGEVIEAFIDVELSNGKAVTWWAEIRYSDEHFTLDTSFLQNDAEGQSVLHKFHSISTSKPDQLKMHFTQALMWAKMLDHYAAKIARTPAIESSLPNCISQDDTWQWHRSGTESPIQIPSFVSA